MALPASAQQAQQQNQQTHVVQPGETLFRIALRYGVTVEAMVAANNLADPSHIEVGQTLIIPSTSAAASSPIVKAPAYPVYYVVQPGDTLNVIALRYGITPAALTAANGIMDPDQIYVGQSLLIPGLSSTGNGATAPNVPANPPPVAPPPTLIPPTNIPLTATPIPPTNVPPTVTAIPPTNLPPPATAIPPTALPPTPAPSTVALRTHVVQPGEDLAQIAQQYGVNWSDLVALNNLADPNIIQVGMTLKIPASPNAPPTTMETSQGVPPGPLGVAPDSGNAAAGKQIVVVLHEERVYAYENGQLVRNVLVSTGLPGTPTVVGTFHIYAKYTAQLMVGPDYYLPNVPWVMYFYEGYSFHGTYWHHNWGHPMSHGCVNMPTDEALWLYNWAPMGTLVTVMY